MSEQTSADAATPAARVDIEDIYLGIEGHIGIARRSADGKSDDNTIIDRDKNRTVRRAAVQPDPGPIFASIGDCERLERAGGNDAGIGGLPGVRMDRRDAIDIFRASRADHAAFRMRKE